MLNYVHQLVANFVCLLLGAEQLVHSGFFTAFSQLPAVYKKDAVRVVRVNQDINVAGPKTKTINWKSLKCFVELKWGDICLFGH